MMRQHVPGKVSARLTQEQQAALERVADAHAASLSCAARIALDRGLRLLDVEYRRTRTFDSSVSELS